MNRVQCFDMSCDQGYMSTSWTLYFCMDRRGYDRMVVGFTTTCAISAYHHWSCEFESRSTRGILDTTSCDKICQWLATGRLFSPGTPVSSTNKTDHHDITEILLKVAFNTINQTNQLYVRYVFYLTTELLKLLAHE